MESMRQRSVVFLAVAVSAICVLVPLAAARSGLGQAPSPLATPAWARPLSGVRPYAVQRNFGTSRGLTCDLRIYTTNRRALDGHGRSRPGDVTATVCVVRRVQP